MRNQEKKRKKIYLLLRIVAVMVFAFLIVPYSFLMLSFSIYIDETITVNNIDEDGYALLTKEFELLRDTPDGSTIIKFQIKNDFPSSDFDCNIYCSMPAISAMSFLERYHDKPLKERYDGKYLYSVSLIDEGTEFSKVSVYYSVKNGVSSDLNDWIKTHGSKKTSLIILVYWFAVIVVIVVLIFPYGRIRKKAKEN